MWNTLGVIALWNLGVPEMLVIFGIVVMFFGAKRIPELARSFGSGIKEFKKSLNAPDDEDETPTETIDDKPSESSQTNP